MTTNSTSEATPRTAYSYIRFSTPEQRQGTSYQRQFEHSRAYIQRRGLVLDSTLNLFDEGLSAFTGENRESGALSEFLTAIKTGKVKRGSVLIVENLDRLSRQAITKAIALFLEILSAGVEIVTLGDNEQVYTEEGLNANYAHLIVSLTSFARGHEESAIKSQRLSATWKLKRANPEKKLTALSPAWLNLSLDRKSFEVIQDRADLVNRIFRMSASGVGHHRIAKTLNVERIPVWGRGRIWHSSYIMKILSSRSVLGEYQPHQKPRGGKRVPVGEPMGNYFPAIVSPELFQKVHAGNKNRQNLGGRVGPQISNLFTHIAKCGYCESPMQFVQKGAGNTYLVCSAAKAGAGCKYMSWPYSHFEAKFLKFVEELDYSQLTSDSAANPIKEKLAALEKIEARMSELALKQQRLMTLVEQGNLDDSGTIGQRLQTLQHEEKQAQEERDVLKEDYQTAWEQHQELKLNSGELVKLISGEMSAENRQKLVSEIRRKVKRIDVCPCGGLTRAYAKDLIGITDHQFDELLALKRRDEEQWYFSISFVNGERRTVAPRTDGYIVHGSSLPPSLREESGWTPEDIEGVEASLDMGVGNLEVGELAALQ